MKETRAVLFDLDGTLIDSQPAILASGRAALRALGHEPPPTFTLTIGPPIEDVMRAALQPYGDTRVDEAVRAYRADYAVNGITSNQAYPGVADALREIRAAGLRLFLATSKRTIFARPILEHLGLAEIFEGIYGSEPGGTIDHKPELIAHIMSKHALPPNRTVMVGDKSFDIAGAHANNVRAAGVLWGYGSREELEHAGADRLIESTTNLAVVVISMLDDLR